MELPGNAWVNTLIGIYHLSPTNPGSSLRSNLGEGRDDSHWVPSQHSLGQNTPSTIACACITSFGCQDGSFCFAIRSMPALLVSWRSHLGLKARCREESCYEAVCSSKAGMDNPFERKGMQWHMRDDVKQFLVKQRLASRQQKLSYSRCHNNGDMILACSARHRSSIGASRFSRALVPI